LGQGYYADILSRQQYNPYPSLIQNTYVGSRVYFKEEDKMNLWDLFQSKEMRLVKKYFFKESSLDLNNPYLQKLIFDLFKDKLIEEAQRLEKEKI